jgi:hypothetical protein
MISFVVFLVSGLATALDLAFLLFSSGWGAPVHVLEFVASSGAALLCASAYVSLWKPRVASQLAFAAALAEWAFYLPALRTTVPHWHAYSLHSRAGVYALAAIVCLLAVSLYAGVQVFRPQEKSAGTTPHINRNRRVVLGFTGVGLLCISGAILFVGLKNSAEVLSVVLPDGYQGWVRIDFGVRGMPSLPKQGDRYTVTIPESGTVRTSTQLGGRSLRNEYRYGSTSVMPQDATAFLMHTSPNTGTGQESEYILIGKDPADKNHPLGPDGMPVPGNIASGIQH